MATATPKAAPAGTAKPATKPAAKPASSAKAAAAKASNDVGESAFAFSNAARDQYDTLLKAFNENAEEAHDRAQELFDATREGFETAQSRFQEASAEALEAARQDVADAVDFAGELSRSKTVGEALEVQRDYWTRFFETRVERARALSETTAEVVRETTEPMSRSASNAFTAPFQNFNAFFPFASK